MTYVIFLTIAAIIIYVIYRAIKGFVSRTFDLKEIDKKATIENLQESHCFSEAVASGSLGNEKNIARLYEEMCVLHPLKYKDDPRIPDIVLRYRSIINGAIADPNGINTPSLILLDQENPDYETYIKNQAKYNNASYALKNEASRIKKQKNERDVRNQFFAYIVSQGIPLSVVSSAVTDAKIDSFETKDWQKFIKVVKIYLQASEEHIVSDFVGTFDEKEIILNHKKFEQYVVFKSNKVPNETIIEIIRGRITIDQAYRILSLVEDFQYKWNEAINEVLSEDLKKQEEIDLRKKYHWDG